MSTDTGMTAAGTPPTAATVAGRGPTMLAGSGIVTTGGETADGMMRLPAASVGDGWFATPATVAAVTVIPADVVGVGMTTTGGATVAGVIVAPLVAATGSAETGAEEIGP